MTKKGCSILSIVLIALFVLSSLAILRQRRINYAREEEQEPHTVVRADIRYIPMMRDSII